MYQSMDEILRKMPLYSIVSSNINEWAEYIYIIKVDGLSNITQRICVKAFGRLWKISLKKKKKEKNLLFI